MEYETSSQKLKKIPQLVAQVFKGIDKTELNRVHLIEFGESSLNYEVVYFFGARDYLAYRDAHQQVMMRIIEIFEKEKIVMAYPVRRVVK